MFKLETDTFYRWETSERYYMAFLKQDLLGDWVVNQYWGSKISRLGGSKMVCVQTENQGIQYLEKLNNKRIKRGYEFLKITYSFLT